MIMSEIREKAEQWLAAAIDEDAKQEIREMLSKEDPTALTDAFYKDLEFGTGGLRGIMGMGSNRMNKYTIGKATQGLANYLNKQYPGEVISVAVAYDSRNNSREFAQLTANVFSANGIVVYLFEELRPTPELSFAVRHFGCKSGVVITASHNPKEYNGYKAYGADGAQLTPPHDLNVIGEVNAITDLNTINFNMDAGKIKAIGKEIDTLYIEAIKGLSLSPEAINRAHDVKIIFSSIHGTGTTLVPEVLKQMGFSQVYEVEEQATPDGNFPTVVYPNPEESEALTLALKKAKDIDADLVMATDPDADRVGIAVRNDQNEFQLLNGNQTGSLLIYYLLKKWEDLCKIKGNEYVVKTIVTSELIADIAAHFKVDCFDTLTGFKYIATMIRELEGEKVFIGGGEESYGYLIGDFVRDKDAVASCAMIAEMAAYAREKGKTLFELLMDIYAQFGFYLETLSSITKTGKEGAEEIDKMMQEFRNSPPKTLGGSPVIKVVDYQAGKATDMSTGKSEDIEFPRSNVLQFFTKDGAKVSARPSGTEPKIKFYFGVKKAGKFNPHEYAIQEEELLRKIEIIKNDLSLN